MADSKSLTCPLCNANTVSDYWSDTRSGSNSRDYYQCEQCQLVFVPPWQHLPADQEKAHYDFHENSPEDNNYRQFLSRLADPLIMRLDSGAEGLDFGAGPGPTLSVILEEAGFTTSVYDIFYARDESVLEDQYDFITATEVVEHLSKPGGELARLWALLKPGGWLGLMTKMVLNKEAFSQWHYKNDPTHISFFSRETFDYLFRSWGVTAEYQANDVILVRKGSQKGN
ncbi:MAG: class I SAM-dependent methyltransferase [Porticoccus sp.]